MRPGPQHKNEYVSSQRTLFQNTGLIFDKLLPNYTSVDALQCCLFCISEYGFRNTEAVGGGINIAQVSKHLFIGKYNQCCNDKIQRPDN